MQNERTGIVNHSHPADCVGDARGTRKRRGKDCHQSPGLLDARRGELVRIQLGFAQHHCLKPEAVDGIEGEHR